MILLPKREDLSPASLERFRGGMGERKRRECFAIFQNGGYTISKNRETPFREEYGEQSTPVVFGTIKTFLFPSSFKKVLRHFYAEYSPHTNAATFSFSRLPLSQSSVFLRGKSFSLAYLWPC
jgi:hypothetical protein